MTNAEAANTTEDATIATEVAASASGPEDMASHNDNALHTGCLQSACQIKNYSTQDCEVARNCTGPLPCGASGGE